jgi:glutaredoxin
MKKLFYKNNIFYLEDDMSNNRNNIGKTHLIDKYKITKKKMPHKYFKDHIVIYGRYSCPYCQNAIELLKNNKKVIFVEVDTESPIILELNTKGTTNPRKYLHKDTLVEILKDELKGHTTVPIIFKDGKFIGGFSNLNKII